MLKKLLLWFLILFSLLSIVIAQPVNFVVFNSSNAVSFTNQTINYVLYTSDSVVIDSGLITLSQDSSFTLNLENNRYSLDVYHTSKNMQIDYYAHELFTVSDSNNTINVALRSSGKIQIIVQSKDKKAIPDAIVRLDCPSETFQQDSYFTDKLGEVNINFVPAETCFLRAAYEDNIYREYINITQGEKIVKVITFEKVREKNFMWYIYLALIILLIASLLFIFKKKLLLKKSKPIPLTSSPNNSSFFREELIDVLNSREQEVLKFLLTQYKLSTHTSPETFFLNQAKIIFGANIPKTSLVRIFSSLEQKGLLRIEKIGKSKRVYFGFKFLIKQ